LNPEVKQQQLEWRRSQILELTSKGYSQREIARELQVDLIAVKRYLVPTTRNIFTKLFPKNPVEEYDNLIELGSDESEVMEHKP
jgi:DNA-binding NarL/FixJ family response regulator